MIAIVPGAPVLVLDPRLALALFVAPTLLDAAYDASPRDLRDNLVPIVSLAVVAVLLTIGGVAVVARHVVRGLSWAAAIVLGAIVAPPDASAASAVLRKLEPPHRLLVILEGESLFNDATSLLIYRVAVGAALTGTFSGWTVAPMLLLTCGGGIVVGWLLARLYVRFALRVDDLAIGVLLQFVSTFAVWIIADRVGLSAILTVVAYAMTLARRVGGRLNARQRIASYAVWDVTVLVLNVLAFVLIGLQLRAIAGRVHGRDWQTYALCAAAVCGAVIVVRFAWVMLHTTVDIWRIRRFGARTAAERASPPTPRTGLVASWCGMRGIVTLATALALPVDAFPHRDLVVFSAFCVVLVTLVIQGLTLRPLMQWLKLRDDGTVAREVDLARAETARAALRALDNHRDSASPSGDVLRREYQARLKAADVGVPVEDVAGGDASIAALLQHAINYQREALRDLRARHVIGDDALHAVEREIDLLELSADPRVRPTIDRRS